MLMNLQSGAKRNKRNSCAARDRHTALGQPVEQLVCDKLGCAAVYLILQLYCMLVRYIDYKARDILLALFLQESVFFDCTFLDNSSIFIPCLIVDIYSHI